MEIVFKHKSKQATECLCIGEILPKKAAGSLGQRFGAPEQEDVAKAKIALCFSGSPIEKYKQISELSQESNKQFFEQFEEESDFDFDDTDNKSNASKYDSSFIAFQQAIFENIQMNIQK